MSPNKSTSVKVDNRYSSNFTTTFWLGKVFMEGQMLNHFFFFKSCPYR